MRSVKGFTLIELMVTIAVAAVLLGLAVPSFQRVAANNALKSTTRDLIATINTARMQSVSTRTDVSVTPASGGWGNGWELAYTSDTIEESKEFTPGKNVDVSRDSGTGAVTFLARGGLAGGAAAFSVCHQDSEVRGRTVTVSFLGKVTTEFKDDCP